ncbi:hypothetical protein B0I33_105421 [Prauserella shujinwangii]|uniref:Uncharacterized protein n=1 Tax=Prauserella shujinwangii TaxID=1453103 RepID=A0A2T0LVK0_9PSEU|nr:hypothetical protein [Prauserella shujinwangii]PRX47838.1 hypothetical protein B0I33_105421 [Prauserella shujinwangii]
MTDRYRKPRRIAAYAAVAGTVPYLALKLSWLSGGSLGLRDPELVDTTAMYVANAVTGGMDLVALLLAFAFAQDWGRRLPGWLVLFPMWVGTGFLLPIALGIPVIGVELGGGAAEAALAGWVRPLVYGGFAWQGCTLLTAFVLYALDRWEPLFARRTAPGPVGVSGIAGAAMAVGTGGTQLVWAVTGTGNLATRVLPGIDAALAFGAVVGVVLLAGGRLRFATPLVWAGSADMFAWGFWAVFSGVLMGEPDGQAAVGALRMLGGVLLAVALAGKAADVMRKPLFTRRAHA